MKYDVEMERLTTQAVEAPTLEEKFSPLTEMVFLTMKDKYRAGFPVESIALDLEGYLQGWQQDMEEHPECYGKTWGEVTQAEIQLKSALYIRAGAQFLKWLQES